MGVSCGLWSIPYLLPSFNGEVLMVQEPLFRPRPKPGDLFTPGSQNYRLYERLLAGEVTNAEIVRHMNIYNSTGRAADVRKALKPYLVGVEATRICKGLWKYKLKG
jgi:hypothetical protein